MRGGTKDAIKNEGEGAKCHKNLKEQRRPFLKNKMYYYPEPFSYFYYSLIKGIFLKEIVHKGKGPRDDYAVILYTIL